MSHSNQEPQFAPQEIDPSQDEAGDELDSLEDPAKLAEPESPSLGDVVTGRHLGRIISTKLGALRAERRWAVEEMSPEEKNRRRTMRRVAGAAALVGAGLVAGYGYMKGWSLPHLQIQKPNLEISDEHEEPKDNITDALEHSTMVARSGGAPTPQQQENVLRRSGEYFDRRKQQKQ